MMQPVLNTGITLTQYSPWVWHVSLDGRRVGTVSGDPVVGYIARDIQHHSIGRYANVETATQAWLQPGSGALDTRPWVRRTDPPSTRLG